MYGEKHFGKKSASNLPPPPSLPLSPTFLSLYSFFFGIFKNLRSVVEKLDPAIKYLFERLDYHIWDKFSWKALVFFMHVKLRKIFNDNPKNFGLLSVSFFFSSALLSSFLPSFLWPFPKSERLPNFSTFSLFVSFFPLLFSFFSFFFFSFLIFGDFYVIYFF
jgi:hypothetical protein